MTKKFAFRDPIAFKRGGRHIDFLDLTGPRSLDEEAAAVLPANDASSTGANFMAAPSGVTPFDNGTTLYRYIAFALLTGTGLRVSYSNALTSGWTNEVAVTGTTGTPVNPVMSIDINGLRNSGSPQAATKRLFYIDSAVAANAAGRLRVATIDNDNNKTLSGDAAVTLTNILAASGWNKNLRSIHYAKEDAMYATYPVADRNVQDNGIFLLAVFDDGTNSYLGAIYGPTLSELKSKKINVLTDFPSLSAIGPVAIAPLVSEYNQLVGVKNVGFMAVITNSANTLGTAETASLAIGQGSLSTLRECGNSFLGLGAAPATANVFCRAFFNRPDQEVQKYSLLVEGDTTADSQYWAHFRAFGAESLDSGEAAYT